jgi:hypothetical protein
MNCVEKKAKRSEEESVCVICVSVCVRESKKERWKEEAGSTANKGERKSGRDMERE